jgi:rhodanese-related sulfurtransferase
MLHYKELLRSWTNSGEGLIDFRTESEFQLKHICGSTSIPWAELKNRGTDTETIYVAKFLGNELPPKVSDLFF